MKPKIQFALVGLFLLSTPLFLNCNQVLGKKEESSNTNNMLLGIVYQENQNRIARAKQLCETEIDSGYTSGSYAQLCTPEDGAGRFFRIEGMEALGDNGYFYLFLGYDTTPTATTIPSSGKYSFAMGKSQSNVNPLSWFRNSDYGNYQGGQNLSGANPSSFSLSTAQEVCVNFSEDSSKAPQVNLWVTGISGADCQKKSSLTTANAIINYSNWPTQSNSLSTSTKVYYRISSTALLTATKITVDTVSIF